MNEYKFISKFKTFVDEINLENGRNYKLSILEKYKDDDCIKYFLQLVYDPFIVFGISEKKLNKDVGHQSGTMWLDYPEDSEIFEYLKTHNTGTDKDIWTVQQFKKTQVCDDCKDLFDKIITKNLILGISCSTINKVFGKNTIREFNVMLANKYFDKPEIVEGKEFALTTKIDGMRCIMMKENGNVTFWSRQGQPIEGLVDLEKEAQYFPDHIVLDGELVAAIDNPDTYKETMQKATTKSLEKHGLKMKVFDCLSIDDFKSQISDPSCNYNFRRSYLRENFIWASREKAKEARPQYRDASIAVPVLQPEKLDYFELLPILYQGTDTNKIEEILKEQVANGEEGIMINIVDAPYEFKRSNSLLKCKLFNDTEVKIIGFKKGDNKYSNTLGSLICDYKGYKLFVGSGIKDGNKYDQRDYIWTHQDEYLGKLAVIKYFEETTNADGGKSLRFPVYKGIRLKEDV